jgi:periplasmic protein TonB
MLGVLIESKARRQRRTGGAALSIAAHVAIIGAVTAASAHGAGGPPEPVKVEIVKITPPAPTPRAEPRHVAVPPAARASSFAAPVVPRISVPTSIPTTLPTIEPSHGPPLDSIIIGGPASSGRPGRPGLIDGTDNVSPNEELSGAELMMRVLTLAKPRYPEMLRQSGIEGRVLVRFTVDTLGRVDMRSIQVMQTTHDLFTNAVRDALQRFRFKPTEVRGRRVPALAEMPFEFSIGK